MRVREPPCHADGSDIVLVPNLNAAVHTSIKGKTTASADTQCSSLESAAFQASWGLPVLALHNCA
jgi:hypothetical protein